MIYQKHSKTIYSIMCVHSIPDSRRHACSKLKHSDKSTKDVTHGVFLAAPQKLVGSPLKFQLPGNETAMTEVTPGYAMTPGKECQRRFHIPTTPTKGFAK